MRELSSSLSLFPLLSIDLWLGFSEISENTRKIFSSSSFSLSHRQKYTSHSKHIITNKLFIKMATSSTFIAQPNFLVKKNVFTVSQSRRASFFLCARFRSSSKSRSHFARDTKVMMTCKKSWTKTNSNKYVLYLRASTRTNTLTRSLSPSVFSRFSHPKQASKSRTPLRTAGGRGSVVKTEAFFNFGKKKEVAGQPMVCIDCGYIYRGDFSALPNSYRCPTCGVGKNRFKAAMTPAIGVAPPKKQAPTFNTAGVLAEKRKNKEAFRARRAAAGKKKSPRELAREKMLEEQAKKDAKRGGGLFGR